MVKVRQPKFYSILSNIAFFIIVIFFMFWLYWVFDKMRGFSCSGAWAQLLCSMWVLVPQSGIEPTCSALETWSLNHWTTREVPGLCPIERNTVHVKKDAYTRMIMAAVLYQEI